MSKIIKITEEHINVLREQFEKAIQDIKIPDGKFSFVRSFADIGKKAKLYFTETAWLKMQMLIREYTVEIGWYGVASRSDDEENAYIISDILVYPQTVTGTTVDMDAEKCAIWMFENREDERFDNIHMQGHSHVNMSVSPSGVDLGHQEDILDMLDENGFYIFLIWNKRNEKYIKIYDLEKNVLFETADVTVTVKNEIGLDDFLEEAKKVASTKTYTPAATSGYNAYGNAYNGYTGYSAKPTPVVGAGAPAAATTAKTTVTQATSANKKNEKKGKPVSSGTKTYQGKIYHNDDDDDYDPYRYKS